MAPKNKRPTGVTVIAILVIIGGIFLFFGGILAAVVAMLFPAWPAGVNLELRDELTRDFYANAPQLL